MQEPQSISRTATETDLKTNMLIVPNYKNTINFLRFVKTCIFRE